MPIFNKKENELKTRFDKWLFFLQNLEDFDEIPRILNEPIFKKGFEIAKIAKMTAQEYRQYESSRLAYSENKAIVDTARQEGFVQGEEKGKIEGKIEAMRIAVVNMLGLEKFGIEQIADILEVDIDFVEKIQQELKK